MPAFKTLDQLDPKGKRVVVRVDLNVPIENGEVRDTTRIDRIVPTLRELLDKGAAIILLAHFERPKGKVVPELSLRPVAPAVEKALGRKVDFIFTDWHDGKAVAAAKAAKPGQCLVMENTRFHAGEELNDPALARLFASLGDAFVNDAFSAAHRAHASTEGIAHLLPSYAGRAMEAELKALGAALETPKRPLVAVIGGAKISTKLDLIGNLASLANILVIGGGMANTFLGAEGYPIGKSLCERNMFETARAALAKAKQEGCTFLLPADVVVAKEFKANTPSRTIPITDVAADDMILDVGEGTVKSIMAAFDKAKTLVWNGPLGAFETAPFDKATVAAACHAAQLTRAGKLVSVAGGGDTVAALNHAGVAGDFTYVSTAGGAFLEWLEGKQLPGVAALSS